MALKDSFINLNKALRTTLQNVPAVVDTLIRGFDEVADAAEAEGTYSNTERVVGTWTDGSKIYERTFAFTDGIDCGASTFTNLMDTPDGVDKIIFGYVSIANNGAGTGYVRNYNSKIQYLFPVASKVYGLTIRYTKTGANRAPESDTKNGEDDEPDVKTIEKPSEELKK